MTYPWIGRREPLPVNAFVRAADTLGCAPAAIRAVWQVEATGRFYDAQGGVLSRYEPHHFPNTGLNWRDSLALSADDRQHLFMKAYKANPELALRASSWGGPQIMGFNAMDAGWNSATQMVEAMANSELAHLTSFVALVQNWGLDSAIRAHDWLSFARRYNGSGQPKVYAGRMERAYRSISRGAKSPTVLRFGSRGAAVRKLQAALGQPEDGAFGPQTLKAVQTFQADAGLRPDGIVGAKTWAALEKISGVKPKAQSTCTIIPAIIGAMK